MFKPMLADTYKPSPELFMDRGPVFSQPKLDGIRAIATANGLHSRSGRAILTAPHITAALAPLFEADPGLVLDGELYRHEHATDFGAILSAFTNRKGKGRAGVPLEFHVFDMTRQDGDSGDFSERLEELGDILADVDSPHVRAVPTVEASKAAELDAAYADYLAAGYEGQMIRRDAPYWNGRTVSLLKRREFRDAEFRIVAVEEGTGSCRGLARSLVCRLPDGRPFGANLATDRDTAARILADRTRFVGRLATVRFQAMSPVGVPRFPVVHAIYEAGRP